MEFRVGAQIECASPTDEFLEWAETSLTLENPEYLSKKKRGISAYGVSPSISLYRVIGDSCFIPFGLFREVYGRFGGKFQSLFPKKANVSYKSRISLYGYQETAVAEMLKSTYGVLVSPCGSGKTQMGLELVARVGGRCLWLTHTRDLLAQSMRRAKACFGLPAEEYGSITDGKVNIKSITFATVQTMAKVEPKRYADCFDCVIVDECHHCIGSPTRVMQFYKVLSSLNARHKFGLTATPNRADGLEKSMFALIGPVAHEVSRKDIPQCRVVVKIVRFEYRMNKEAVLAGDGTIDFTQLINDLTENLERQRLILSLLLAEPRGEPAMVLADRVEYLERLADAYDSAGRKGICLSGKTKKAERQNALALLENGNVDCVFATFQLAKEGLDVPNLRRIVFATPKSDEATVIQASGRVARIADGKEKGEIIDVVDSFGLFRRYAAKRKNIYKKLGYEIS